MSCDFDIAIIGSGFGGSLLAQIARKLGRSVILIERGKHPRFAVGESSTPLANLLLEELARRYDLPRLSPLTKWGAWQRAYPQIGCGLKRGFTFYHHRFAERFGPDHERKSQLLVAASPRDEIADTHWFRQDFDSFLVAEARGLGAEYSDETELNEVSCIADGAVIAGQRKGKHFAVGARIVFDATGPRGFLHRCLKLAETPFEYLPPTQGLFSHFAGVRRLDEMGLSTGAKRTPYPVDDAAVHHIFEGGWIWVLRFNNGIASAGVAATDTTANHFCFAEGENSWRRLLEALPTVAEQFRGARAVMPFVHAPRLNFRSAAAAGARWALLPSAAGFVDPLLSTGFPLTLLGIGRLARALEQDWGTQRFPEALRAYSRQTIEELLAAERLVAALYASFDDFAVFSQLALLYFAAVSFSETARRLDRSECARGFLLHDHPHFGPRARNICERVMRKLAPFSDAERAELRHAVRDAIEPIDVAGLARTDRKNWYPAQASDAIDAAHKLGVSGEEMRRFLARCGFADEPAQ